MMNINTLRLLARILATATNGRGGLMSYAAANPGELCQLETLADTGRVGWHYEGANLRWSLRPVAVSIVRQSATRLQKEA